MKKILLAVLMVGVLSACEVDDEPAEQSQMVVYIIDYDSNDFQAGTVLNFAKVNIDYTEIEVDIDEDAPENGLDGAVSLIYEPTGDKIFEGSLNAEGNAEINFPGLTLGSEFYEIENSVATPSVQDIGESYTNNFSRAWGSVDRLGLSEIFVDNDALVGRYLYRPSPTNDDNWKWVVLLLDQ